MAQTCILKKRKKISIIGKRQTGRFDYTTIAAEAEYSVNFAETKNKFFVSLMSYY